MGIINVSPDSFSSDGTHTVEEAVTLAERFEEYGADILDIGGESTRPGASPISTDEEITRVVPAIEQIARKTALPLSVDTYKPEVALAAISAGAHIINDIWGLKHSFKLADVATSENTPIILTSNQRNDEGAHISDAIVSVFLDLGSSIELAIEHGIPWENIIIDPGIGFGKTTEQNLSILRHLERLKPLGRPILVGTSRKSMIGHVLNLPPEERIEGTAATVAISIANGADIVRVHDVYQMKRLCQMSDAIVRGAYGEKGTSH
ncbi:MAG: dihydropteroate synthase [Chloroflexota bacterium]|nr:dihydropteroate synthase [Chloroflexota bacterium]